MKTDFTLTQMITRAQGLMRAEGARVHTERWQGMDVSKKPEMQTVEVLNFYASVDLRGEERLPMYRAAIKPNLPWADNHFEERVCGYPINPGVEYANWPWASDAKAQLEKDGGIFNHNYMERYWPKFAGSAVPIDVATYESLGGSLTHTNHGIRHEYGDLNDLVSLLANEPLTRQAWMPIFFPEDTGVGDGGRKPCTLGYQFVMRDDRLHVYYPLRSCDLVRHFRDDIYLTIRLLLWVLSECRRLNPSAWAHVRPGSYTMHCTSLHVFVNDWRHVEGGQP